MMTTHHINSFGRHQSSDGSHISFMTERHSSSERLNGPSEVVSRMLNASDFSKHVMTTDHSSTQERELAPGGYSEQFSQLSTSQMSQLTECMQHPNAVSGKLLDGLSFETDDEFSLLVAAAATALLDGDFGMSIIDDIPLTQESQTQNSVDFDHTFPDAYGRSSSSIMSRKGYLTTVASKGVPYNMTTASFGSQNSTIWGDRCDNERSTLQRTDAMNPGADSRVSGTRPFNSVNNGLSEFREWGNTSTGWSAERTSRGYNPAKCESMGAYSSNDHPSALLFTGGVGGRHFSPPVVLAHPEEFRNPSSFLKVYGDPLCGLEGTTNDLSKNEFLKNNVMKGKNGNWVCPKCMNVNYPRRFRCNKCNEMRDGTGDAIVSDYALQVYFHHMKIYKKLGKGSQHQLGQLGNNSLGPAARRPELAEQGQRRMSMPGGLSMPQNSNDRLESGVQTSDVLRRFNSQPVPSARNDPRDLNCHHGAGVNHYMPSCLRLGSSDAITFETERPFVDIPLLDDQFGTPQRNPSKAGDDSVRRMSNIAIWDSTNSTEFGNSDRTSNFGTPAKLAGKLKDKIVRSHETEKNEHNFKRPDSPSNVPILCPDTPKSVKCHQGQHGAIQPSRAQSDLAPDPRALASSKIVESKLNRVSRLGHSHSEASRRSENCISWRKKNQSGKTDEQKWDRNNSRHSIYESPKSGSPNNKLIFPYATVPRHCMSELNRVTRPLGGTCSGTYKDLDSMTLLMSSPSHFERLRNFDSFDRSTGIIRTDHPS